MNLTSRNLSGADTSLIQLIYELSLLAPKLSHKGSLSRLGNLRRLFMLTGSAYVRGSFVLVDHNRNKLAAAERYWMNCDFLNPYLIRPCLAERVLILMATLVGRNLRLSLQAVGIGLSVNKILGRNTTTIIWNPTQVFHHGIAVTATRTECYLKSPIVPLPRNCEKFVGVEAIGEIYGLDRVKFRAHEVDHNISSKCPRFAIYLTKLDVDNAKDRRLLQFAKFLVANGQTVKIFLHYRDRKLPLHHKVKDFPPGVVSLEESLTSLSSEQISISGSSTVGLEISSILNSHFFCIGSEPDVFGRNRTVTPFYTYLSRKVQVLRTSQSDEEWFTHLTARANQSGLALGSVSCLRREKGS